MKDYSYWDICMVGWYAIIVICVLAIIISLVIIFPIVFSVIAGILIFIFGLPWALGMLVLMVIDRRSNNKPEDS